ncbi:hypothetical protein [Undibacterium sp. Di24W]|uniref:hypothetical protein n=1 Tax=Undibacterium sp. Di24W TaxID=3413033 RepID=UPI003BF2252F
MSDVAEVRRRVTAKLWRAASLYSFPAWIAIVAPWIILRQLLPVLMELVAAVLYSWWTKKHIDAHWISWSNASFPELEDSMHLLASDVDTAALSSVAQLQRARLSQKIEHAFNDAACRHLARRYLSFPRSLIILSCLLSVAWFFVPAQTTALKDGSLINEIKAKPSLQHHSALSVHVTPPAYTKLPAFTSAPKEMQIPENSQVRWCMATPSSAESAKEALSIHLSNGQTLIFVQRGEVHCAEWQASETVFWSWSADAAKTRIVLKVQLDQAPQIKITTPTDMVQVLAQDAKQVRIALRITDDYQITQASMHMTLARGSGENIRFSDKEMPVPQGKDSKLREWDKLWSLSELGMEPGDELYFFVRATDNADKNPHITRSPTYTLRLPSPDAAAEESLALPMMVKVESLRSQRQIIIDTEQLLADIKANPKLNPNLIRTRSEMIAGDQGALRRRYGKFLGEESSLFADDDGDHGDHSDHDGHGKKGDSAPVDLAAQYGHAHDQEENATLFDEATKKILRRALAAMWDAEKSLRAITPASALAPENKALEAIKQLQQADRIYLHKAAFTPPAIKEEKRMSGDVLDLKNTSKKQNEAAVIVPEAIRNLLITLQRQDSLPALWSKTARDWIAEQINNEEQRLAAQAAIQDVIDGCATCRPALAAWIRQGISHAELILQGRSVLKPKQNSAFDKAWEASLQNKQPPSANGKQP